jgi:hypothetical protein
MSLKSAVGVSGRMASLEWFIVRSQVLQLYRRALKTARRLPRASVQRQDTVDEIRREFRLFGVDYEQRRDVELIKQDLAVGKRRVQELQALLDQAGYV